MNSACLAVPVAIACSLAAGDVYIEVAPTSEGPDGFNNAGAVIGAPDELGVWLWSDEPGVKLGNIGFDLNGFAEFGGGDGGTYLFDGVGDVDPDDLWFGGIESAGVLIADQLIDDIEIFVPLLFLVDVGVGPENGILLYSGFTGTAWSAGAGVRPEVYFLDILQDNNTFTGEVHELGWFQSPSPGALGLLGMAGLVASRRRR